MSKDLITKLSNLKLKESSLKRCLDKNCFNSKGKARVFEELEKVENEIKLTKFKFTTTHPTLCKNSLSEFNEN